MAVWRKIQVLLEMIKFKHTVFALPFGLMGAFLAARGAPRFWVLFWVVLAMVGARTAAMGFNRIADRRFDAANPRTAGRALPAGEVTLSQAWAMVVLAACLFFLSCAMLNPLALGLSPLALGFTFFYSLTKRFTALCHLVLGVALAFAPLGGWVAAAGSLMGYPWPLSLGVACWVAGFDTVYACLDAEFDRRAGLYSLPARFGRRRAFLLAVAFHAAAFACFLATGVQTRLGWPYYLGLAVTGVALFYQHLVVNPRDLSRIHVAFFQMNGLIALALFTATWISLAVSG